ncbi:MAG TPA: hypothetical protein VN306_07105, partial [Mycobacterium sp.]|nr:hypothetical protein [Mycobacterium sp.]
DASLVLHHRAGRSEQISIPHFSGWEATYPVDDAGIRSIFNQWQTEAAQEFEASVAAYISNARQREMLGSDKDAGTIPLDVWEELVARFDRDVLEPRTLLADSGCFEAEKAMQAYVQYERVLQLMGFADNKELYARYRRPIPTEVFDAFWNHCTKDQFQRCVRSGDLPAFAEYFLSIDRQMELLGARVSSAWETEGISYLERCGQWEAKIDTYYTSTGGWSETYEATRDIDIHWKPGGGPFGIMGATMEGSGPVNTLTHQTTNAAITLGPATPQIPATAEITAMTFDEPPWYLPGINPTPRKLTLDMNFGTARWPEVSNLTGYKDYRLCCDSWVNVVVALTNGNEPDWVYVNDGRNPLLGTIRWKVSDGWAFDLPPYRAVIVQDGQFVQTVGTLRGRLEIILKHTPAG